MSCSIKNKERPELLMTYCSGKLFGESRRKLESHMATCAECAAFRDAQTSVWKALELWESPPVSRGFDDRLYAQIEESEAAIWYVRLARMLREFVRECVPRPALPVGLAAMILVGGFLLDHPSWRSTVAGHSASAVSASEAEQVERALDDMDMLRQFDATTEDQEERAKSM